MRQFLFKPIKYLAASAFLLLLSANGQSQTTVTSTVETGSAATTATSNANAITSNASSATPASGSQGAAARAMLQQADAKLASEALTSDATANQQITRVSVPNQFQRFVKETTGRSLSMFGRELFDAPQAYSANNVLPVPDNYLLGPGDEVRLQVFGPQEFSTNFIIDRNGQVTVPKVGVLTLAGVPANELEKTLKAHLGKVFTNFQVSATVGKLRGIQVYVVGQAEHPGTYHLSSLSTLVNALFASGGPNQNGSMRRIELKRGGKTISKLDLYDFISRGDKAKDLPLMSGDVIVIPHVGPRVAITGAFDQAAIYELASPATSIGEILALGGGVPRLATTQKAILERISSKSNPPRLVQEITLDDAGLKQPLQDGDVLTLLGISSAFANAVTLQGTVAAPLRYRWFEGMKILDLIPERDALITGDYYKRKNKLVQNAEIAQDAGGAIGSRTRSIIDEINWDYAVIERLDRNNLTTQIIPFNLGRAVLQKDPSQNLELQSGDIVTVLSHGDLRVPQDRQTRLVRIEGEVIAPGMYQVKPGETLTQLIKRIGGVTPQAYLFGLEFTRESVRARQQANLDLLVRKLENQLQSQATTLAANAEKAELVTQQQISMRSQISHLKSMKSNGRVSLELDTKLSAVSALPELPLEDGDRIFIPSVSSFVAAVGAVNNENVFIYKNGKTVADLLKSAGLSDEADSDQLFILRADGSVITRRDQSGFLGSSFESIALMPGDTVVVPSKLDRESRYNAVVRGMKDWTQILGNLGLGVAALRSLSK